MSNAVKEISVEVGQIPEASEVLELFRRLNWAKMEYRDEERFQRAIEGSALVITAREEERLVGFCRCITDGEYTAYIADVAVAPEYQGNGVGSKLVCKALELLEGYEAVDLIASEASVEFYERFGFLPRRGMQIRRW